MIRSFIKSWCASVCQLGVVFAAMACASPALCADLPQPHTQTQTGNASAGMDWLSQTPISEVRLGAFAHDPSSPEGGSADVNGEILSKKLWAGNGAPWDSLIPRFSLGGTANFVGKTSQAYAGLTWDYDLTRQVFVEASFGGDVNNGKTYAVPGRNAMGCNVMFHENASLGYRLDAHWSVMATIEHSSNAGLCTQNRGLTNYGLRLGYAF